MAFAEGEKGTEYIPTCHSCGRKCKGGQRKCQHITEDYRAKVAALDAAKVAALDFAGHFRRGNNSNNKKNKKGTVNVPAGGGTDDDDDKSKDEAAKTEDSGTSGLTEDMAIGELLRLTGHIHTTAGMRETDGEIYEDDGSWNGDVLASIGVGFCQVQGEKPVKATVVNEQWLMQGRRGTNPLKTKTKNQKVAPSLLKDRGMAQTERHEAKPAGLGVGKLSEERQTQSEWRSEGAD